MRFIQRSLARLFAAMTTRTHLINPASATKLETTKHTPWEALSERSALDAPWRSADDQTVAHRSSASPPSSGAAQKRRVTTKTDHLTRGHNRLAAARPKMGQPQW